MGTRRGPQLKNLLGRGPRPPTSLRAPHTSATSLYAAYTLCCWKITALVHFGAQIRSNRTLEIMFQKVSSVDLVQMKLSNFRAGAVVGHASVNELL